MKKLILLSVALAISCFLSTQIQAQDGIWMTFDRANSGLIGDTITSITFDGNGSLWVAAREGVAKFTQTGWDFYNKPQYMPNNEIWDIDYTNGSLWIAHHLGVTGFDGATWMTYTSDNSGLVSGLPQCLAHDDNGDLWIGTARGLSRFAKDKAWSTYTRNNTPAMPYDGIEALATDPSNTLWMSFISTAGIVSFPGGNGAIAKYFKQDSIPGFPKGAVYIISLARDWNGNLWAGTKKNGVIRINESGATVFSKSIPAIKDSNVRTVAVDRCGNIWIGTDKGAAMYNGSSWRDFGEGTGLPDDTVNIIKVDGAGHIWFGTKGGVTVFKPLPKAPELIMPLMNMTMNTDSVLCQWTWACPGITKYWYEIATNEQFAFSTVDTTSPSLMQSASIMERGLANNTTYYWRTRAQNDAGWGPFSNTWVFHVSYPSDVEANSTMMQSELMQNYPNPCTDNTTIEFYLPKNENVTLEVYDVLGRECTSYESRMGPGMCNVPIDCSTLPSNGIYIYRLKTGKDVLQKVMHVTR